MIKKLIPDSPVVTAHVPNLMFSNCAALSQCVFMCSV